MSDVVHTLPEIHISDQQQFRRCRRKWDLGSNTRRNLHSKAESSSPLWFGSGFHFVMEDYHGYKRFATPFDAYLAYKKCFKPEQLPLDIMELDLLAEGMFKHYQNFLQQRSESLTTLWINSIPQVEVMWKAPSDLFLEGQRIWFYGKFDRICVDLNGSWWILDYKTARAFDNSKLDTDDQVSRYTWAGKLIYPNIDFAGCVWQTHKKTAPHEPEQLKRGGLSVNKQQDTTHFMYRRALNNLVPGWESESKYMEMLDHLINAETPDGDKFIQRTFTKRNSYQLAAAQKHGEDMVIDMLDPNLALYPNPTRDCSWDCDFREACIMMDDGSNWEQHLLDNFEARPQFSAHDDWRKFLITP